MAKVKKQKNLFNGKLPKEIHVTAEDIKKGKQNSACDCAIARALKRTFNVKDVSVSDSEPTVGVVTKANILGQEVLVDMDLILTLPYEAEEFIEAFDMDKKSVTPKRFKLLSAVALRDNPYLPTEIKLGVGK